MHPSPSTLEKTFFITQPLVANTTPNLISYITEHITIIHCHGQQHNNQELHNNMEQNVNPLDHYLANHSSSPFTNPFTYVYTNTIVTNNTNSSSQTHLNANPSDYITGTHTNLTNAIPFIPLLPSFPLTGPRAHSNSPGTSTSHVTLHNCEHFDTQILHHQSITLLNNQNTTHHRINPPTPAHTAQPSLLEHLN